MTVPIRSLLLVTAAVVMLACVAGCGGSSSSSSAESSSTEAETSGGAARAAYVKETDAVCQATGEVTAPLSKELAALTKSGTPETPQGQAKLSELLGRVVVIGREEAQELTSIQPPAGDTAIITRWIDTGEEGLGELEAAASALEEGNTAKFGGFYAEGIATLKRGHVIGQSYGFKVCGAE